MRSLSPKWKGEFRGLSSPLKSIGMLLQQSLLLLIVAVFGNSIEKWIIKSSIIACNERGDSILSNRETCDADFRQYSLNTCSWWWRHHTSILFSVSQIIVPVSFIRPNINAHLTIQPQYMVVTAALVIWFPGSKFWVKLVLDAVVGSDAVLWCMW